MLCKRFEQFWVTKLKNWFYEHKIDEKQKFSVHKKLISAIEV